MTMTINIVSFAGTVGGRFFVISVCAIKKSTKLAYVTIDLFITALAYLEKVQ
jgi:hypothetical protein